MNRRPAAPPPNNVPIGVTATRTAVRPPPPIPQQDGDNYDSDGEYVEPGEQPKHAKAPTNLPERGASRPPALPPTLQEDIYEETEDQQMAPPEKPWQKRGVQRPPAPPPTHQEEETYEETDDFPLPPPEPPGVTPGRNIAPSVGRTAFPMLTTEEDVYEKTDIPSVPVSPRGVLGSVRSPGGRGPPPPPGGRGPIPVPGGRVPPLTPNRTTPPQLPPGRLVPPPLQTNTDTTCNGQQFSSGKLPAKPGIKVPVTAPMLPDDETYEDADDLLPSKPPPSLPAPRELVRAPGLGDCRPPVAPPSPTIDDDNTYELTDNSQTIDDDIYEEDVTSPTPVKPPAVRPPVPQPPEANQTNRNTEKAVRATGLPGVAMPVRLLDSVALRNVRLRPTIQNKNLAMKTDDPPVSSTRDPPAVPKHNIIDTGTKPGTFQHNPPGAPPVREQQTASGGAPPGLPGHTPNKVEDPLADKLWYFPELTSEEAAKQIKLMSKEGAFLVRRSESGGAERPYTLCVLHNGDVFQIQIRKRSQDQKFAFGNPKPDEHVFNSAIEMVSFHQNNGLEVAKQGRDCGKVILTISPQK